ncbi:MAG TPA: mannose-6-phosphate isomerase, class I [Candidatus Acidoferrum sp.]|nr:mannose-6-phosphate isomerase, class I [Candidatus Acidoferrum sp.]
MRIPLERALAYSPQPLSFGTSGRRGKIVDLTQLEVYTNALAELEYLQSLPPIDGGIVRGEPFYLAYDLRPSSTRFLPEQDGRGEIAQAILLAIRDSGMQPVNLGPIPTPALTYYALRHGRGSMMVTGSHVPFDRNGYKTNTARGELRKEDEGPIAAHVARIRERLYREPLAQSRFDERGMLKAGHLDLPPQHDGAARDYALRYTAFFGPEALCGCRVLVYQQAAVGRDLLPAILSALGAEVQAVGRSETFVPIDTEDVGVDFLAGAQSLVQDTERHWGPLDAVVSTDGDSDRPLILGIHPESRRVQFFSGDLLGMVVADSLHADAVVVPISCNDAIDRSPLRAALEPKTRIGSPYVIAGMTRARARGRRAVCGWEANGGFLLGSPIQQDGRSLAALPTRDAVLPILVLLHRAALERLPLTQIFARLPRRHSRAALLRPFPRTVARDILAWLSPTEDPVIEAGFPDGDVTVRRADSDPVSPATPRQASELRGLRDRLTRICSPALGGALIVSINYLDGIRIGFDTGEIAHLRPSGNADEFRIYAVADTPERAEQIALAGIAEPVGILRQLEHAWRSETSAPPAGPPADILQLDGTVRHYDWGGRRFIPALLGRNNPDGRPFAELWYGAHPSAPSEVTHDGIRDSLDRLISASPAAFLGPRQAARFGGLLPFLLKVLAARQPLSVQVHPGPEPASRGFACEQAGGVPLDAPSRMYRDRTPKPEVHVALTDFWLLHGFRPLEQIQRFPQILAALRVLVPDFDRRLEEVHQQSEGRRSLLRHLLTALLTLPPEAADALLDPLLSDLRRNPTECKEDPDYWALRVARQLALPGGPRDLGIFFLYLLNLVHLRPGQGTFQPTGTPHAYLQGVTVELMANSDTVLRGGLTTKPVNAAAFVQALTFNEGMLQILEGIPRSVREMVYPTSACEFELSRLVLASGDAEEYGADHEMALWLAIQGAVIVSGIARTVALSPGGCCLAPHGLPYRVCCGSGPATVFKATLPRPSEARERP